MAQQRLASGRSVEASARSVEEAVQKALARLGKGRDEVEVKVLREASSGLLGIGGHDAIVRVTELIAMPTPSVGPQPEVSRPPVEAAPRPVVTEPPVPVAISPEVDSAPVRTREPQPLPPVEERPAAPARTSQAARPSFHDRDEDDQNFTTGAANRDELLEVSRDVLLDILERMHIIGDVQAHWVEAADGNESSALILDIIGDDLGMLIGRRGETLRDLQYMVRLIVGRRIGGWANIVVDVEGYKQRRESMLRRLARQMADRVALSRRPAFLEPMAAYERRIIHLELRNDPKVSTQSTGEGDRRKVGIYPR
jgi:spoIIIJ-associated protein